jgi:hypothetical protein
MARISLNPPQTLAYRLGSRFTRRRYGAMLDPGAAIGLGGKPIIALTTTISGGRISAIYLVVSPDKLRGLAAGRILSG